MLSVLKANIKITFFIGCLTLLWPLAGFGQDPVLTKGVITAFKLNVRQSPSLTSDVIGLVLKGEIVDVVSQAGEIGGWLTVEYQGKKGFIRNRPQYVRLMPEPAAQPAGTDNSKRKKKKQAIQADLEAHEKLVESFSQREVEIIEGLNEIDYARNKTRLTTVALAQEVMHLESRINSLRTDREDLAQKITRNRDYAGKRLRDLYKMNMIGRIDLVGQPSSLFDFFLQQNAMKQIVTADFKLIEKQNEDLQTFEQMEKELQKEIQTQTALETDLNNQIRIHQQESLKKETILKEIRQKKKLSLAAVESLKLAAHRLDSQIENLQPKAQPATDNLSFAKYKGRLSIPVKGDIISEYGPSTTGDYKSFTFQKGIDIKVQRGEPVKSVFRGEVMFAQWLKGYGNLLIIDHGDNFYTLYAHVEEIFKQKGERVDMGEVIATAGDTGSIKGMCLHFEVRHHGKPVNPMIWLKKGA